MVKAGAVGIVRLSGPYLVTSVAEMNQLRLVIGVVGSRGGGSWEGARAGEQLVDFFFSTTNIYVSRLKREQQERTNAIQ